MSVSMNNSKDLIVNSLKLIGDGGVLKDVETLITEAATDIEGNLTPGQIETISSLSGALNNDPNYFTTIQTALDGKAPLASPVFSGTVGGITKSMVELGNVDNTSDINKPISALTQTALNGKAPLVSPVFSGTVGGINKSMVGLGNVDNTTDLLKPISTSTQSALNLKANLASPTFSGTVSGINKSMVGLGNVDNTTDLNKPISTLTQTALNGKENTITVMKNGASIDLMTGTNHLKSLISPDNSITITENLVDYLINLSVPDLANKANTTDTFLKTVSGNITYLNISSAFRLACDSLLNKIVLEYYDSDGAIITDSWQPMGEFIYNTDTNTASFNGLNVSSNGTNLLTALGTKQGALTFYIAPNGYSINSASSIKGFNATSPIVITDNIPDLALTFSLDIDALSLTLSDTFESSFSAINPLKKTLNIGTGNVELSIDGTGPITTGAINCSTLETSGNTTIGGVLGVVGLFAANTATITSLETQTIVSPGFTGITIKNSTSGDIVKFNDNKTVQFYDNVIVDGSLTVNGSSSSLYWAGGSFSVNGTILKQKGKNNFSISVNGVLGWNISYPAHPDGAYATVLVTSGHYHTLIRSQTSTGFVYYGRSTTNGTDDQSTGQAHHFVVLA